MKILRLSGFLLLLVSGFSIIYVSLSLVEAKKSVKKDLGVAVCVQTTVKAKSTEKVEFSLVWDMPVVWFVGKRRTYKRYV